MRAWDRHCSQPFSAGHSRRIRVYHAAGLSAFHCFVRLASRATSCTSAMMEFMPYALAPAYGVTSMPFRPGCHRPFHHSVVLRSYASAVIVVARFSILWFPSFASATLSTLCFSTSSRQPSSLSGSSPRVSTAGAYCWKSIITPLCRWWFSGTHP